MERDPRAWHRLHPLSPVLRLGRAMPVLVVLGGEATLQHGRGGLGRDVELGVVALGVLASVVAWLVTRWRVEDGDLRIETGLVSRRSRRVPLARLQAVDVVRPLLGRVLGLAELRLRVAGAGRSDTRLSYLAESDAEGLRGQLLELAQRARAMGATSPDGAGPPAGALGPVMAGVPLGRLVASVLLGGPTLLLAAVLAVLAVLTVLAPAAAPGLMAGLAATGFAVAGVAWRRLNSGYGFVVRAVPEGVQVAAGLLSTRTETIPRGRIQGVRVIEPLLWRPFGWCRLEVDVASQRDRDRDEGGAHSVDALLPVGSAAVASALLEQVLPGRRPYPVRPPGRARWKAPLRFHNLAGGWSADYLVTGSGRLARLTAIVPLAKVQSLRRVQGPVARRLRLATVHADIAGRSVRASLLDRDADEAAAVLDTLAALCRQARESARPGAATGGYR